MKCCLALSCSGWHRVDLSQEDSSGLGSKKNLRLPPQSTRHGGLWSVVPPSTTEDWESSKLGTRLGPVVQVFPLWASTSPPPGPPVFSSGTLRLRGKFPACTWDLCGPERWRNLEAHKHPDFQKEGRSCGQDARLLLTLGSPSAPMQTRARQGQVPSHSSPTNSVRKWGPEEGSIPSQAIP